MQNDTQTEEFTHDFSLDMLFENSVESLEGYSEVLNKNDIESKKPWNDINHHTETRTFKAQYAVQKAEDIKKRNSDLSELLRQRARELWDNPDEFFNKIH